MLFLLKKFITFWLLPLPFCLALLGLGLWLTRKGRQSKAGRRLMFLSLLGLAAFSSKPVSRALAGPLELQYPAQPDFIPGSPAPQPLQDCRYIVVLGGGHGDCDDRPPTTKLSESALGRLIEAYRLWQHMPSAKLIVSGPSDGVGSTHASVLADAAVSLGVPRSSIIEVDTARDTEDEANAVRLIAGNARVALVTSAWHMPRSQALFRKLGLDSVPCPADFKVKPNPRIAWRDFTWDTESLTRSTMSVREYLGLAWLKLRNKI